MSWPQLMKRWIALSTGSIKDITIQWITELVSLILTWWIALSTGSINHYSVDNRIYFLNTYLADSAIHWIDQSLFSG